MKKSEIIFGALRLPVDFIATIAAFMLAYYIRPITDLIPGVQYHFEPELLPEFSQYIKFSFIATGFLILIFIFNHLYSLKITYQLKRNIFKVVFLVTTWLMFIIAYYFLVVHQLFFSRIALAHIWIFTNFFILLGRGLILGIQSFLLRYGIGRRKILFIGVTALADRFYYNFKEDKRYEVIGAIADELKSRKIGDLKIIGNLNDLAHIVKKYKIEEIIQADPDIKASTSNNILDFCRSNQISYNFIPDLIRLQRTNVEMQTIDGIPLITLKQTALDGWGHIYKRLFDIIFSLILIIFLIPIWIIIPILIKIDSRGPIFYKSERKYRNKLFGIYKFRSMIINAEKEKEALMKQNERTGPLFKIKNDPRITKFGNFIRKTSIDELPQLFNVLIGAVSLVGPRPHLAKEVEQYKEHHYRVFGIKPGVTGLAQINGRSNLDFEEEVRLDVYYIENWSLWFDIKIILKSVLVVLRADGN